MRVVGVWRENTEKSREIEEWLTDFERRTSGQIEYKNPDTVEGASFIEIYGIVEYPTLIALADDGRVLASWRGLPLPRFDEVAYYATKKRGII